MMNNITATAVVLPAGEHAGGGERSPVRWSPCLGTAANCCPDFVCSAHFNENGTSTEYGGDPGFADLGAGDLTLRADSPIFRDLPGFPHVPFKDIGPTGRVPRVL
jgi:hypothetical protein